MSPYWNFPSYNSFNWTIDVGLHSKAIMMAISIAADTNNFSYCVLEMRCASCCEEINNDFYKTLNDAETSQETWENGLFSSHLQWVIWNFWWAACASVSHRNGSHVWPVRVWPKHAAMTGIQEIVSIRCCKAHVCMFFPALAEWCLTLRWIAGAEYRRISATGSRSIQSSLLHI